MRNLIGLLAFTQLGACGGGSWEGIWMVLYPPTEDFACELDIDENFSDATPIEFEEEVVYGDWTYTEEGKESDGALFMEVLVQQGVAFGVLGGNLYTGTVDGGTLTLAWESSEDTEDVNEHDADYEFSQKVRASVSETLTLDKGKDNLYAGTWKVKTNSTQTWTETDEWDDREVGSPYSMPSNQYLEGDVTRNRSQDDDCASGTCELIVSTKCDTTMKITARFAGDNSGVFDGFEDAQRPNGVSY